jgi:hypothetical protein
MKKLICLSALFITLIASSQTVSGYWYGTANVKLNSSANNYLVELILRQNKTQVKGIINYYFKNVFRSLPVNGTYNSMTRQLTLFNIPLTYHGSMTNLEVDCIMDFVGSLRVAKVGSSLTGSFKGKPEYKYTCVDVDFKLAMNADVSKEDSILKALRTFKESKQLWTPSATDTLAPVVVIQRRVENYVIDREFKERENVVAKEIDTDADSLKVDFYDNGEIDGDSISVFFNDKLLAFNRILSTRAVHFDLVLDSTKEINTIAMFADNLGSIPPNTALMQVTDGKNRWELRLSSTLEKNAVLQIRRKKNN